MASKLWIWDSSAFLLKLLYGIKRVQKIKQMLKLGQQIGLLIILFGSSLRFFFHLLPAVPHVSQNAKISNAKILSELFQSGKPQIHMDICVFKKKKSLFNKFIV